MFILEPLEHQTIWGGSILRDQYSCNNDHIGHLYMVNGHEGMSNRILNGEYQGYTLKAAFDLEKSKWDMSEYEEFPLTIALVDANDNLSIQVHPDDSVAQQLEGKKVGKEESWIFLNAPNSGYIYCGCNAKDKNEVRNAIPQDDFLKIVGKLPIQEEQYVCVKAGTLHAMTSGSLVYEIEYGSDYTYRFYDYKRKDKDGKERELHIEKALEAINPVCNSFPQDMKNGVWIEETYYEICKIGNIVHYVNNSKKIEILSIIEGTANEEQMEIRKGMSVLLFPGEIISNCNIEKAIVSRLK